MEFKKKQNKNFSICLKEKKINAFFCEIGAFYYLIQFKADNDLLVTYEVSKQTLD